MKNIFKKLVVLLGISFILLGYNFVFADVDVTPPVITLNGSSVVSITVGDIYTDAGATAIDDVDGPVTVATTGTVDNTNPGIYTLTYTATDASSNTATTIRTINVKAPVILSNISITTPANKLSYFVGDTLDISGLMVSGTYSDGSTKTETITNSNVSGFDSSVPIAGEILTINIQGKTTTFPIDIISNQNSNTPVSKENFIIRNGDNLIWQGQIDLPSDGEISINGKDVNSRSVLGVLQKISLTTGSFTISDVKDYGSMGMYLKCLTPKDKSPLCENWQYSVGSINPWTSIDTTMLSGEENVGIYFGTTHHVVLDTNNINVGGTISATAEKYNYENNTWSPLSGVSIGLTLPNPKDAWNPTVVGIYHVDSNGNAKIKITDPNKYSLGIVEDYYAPSVDLLVSDPVSSAGVSTIQKSFSIPSAVSFLTTNQKNDGSYGNSLYTDWAAVGISASSIGGSVKQKISDYLKNNPLDSLIVSDNERHAMALMSLGLNPYSDTSINYIKKITDSFDGNQIGDKNLFNDDIFALIVLSKAGYNENDDLIIKDVNYLLSKQQTDGSWGSVDLTAAAIQALNNFRGINGVSSSITRALKNLSKFQGSDGGFGNSFSTSWAIQGLSIEAPLYVSEINKADEYLALKQQNDGGVDDGNNSIENKIWLTSYSIPAISHLSWSNILKSFNKQNNLVLPSSIKIIPTIENNSIVKVKAVEVNKKEIISKIENRIIKPKKPAIKTTTESKDIKNTEKISIVKNNILLLANRGIALKTKALFSWLLVRLGF